MTMNVKAIERQISVGDKRGNYAYVMSPEHQKHMDEKSIFHKAALNTNMNIAAIRTAWLVCSEIIREEVIKGHTVALPGLGSIRLGMKANIVDDIADINSSLIKTKKIIFNPTSKFKNDLESSPINITCYNRNGKIIKKINSENHETIEMNETDE